MEVIRFGGYLQRILNQVLSADLRLGTVLIIKVDLANVYMQLRGRLEEIPSVAFLIPKKHPCDDQLVSFHLSLPMDYVDSTPYFCMSMDMVLDMVNASLALWNNARAHPLETES